MNFPPQAREAISNGMPVSAACKIYAQLDTEENIELQWLHRFWPSIFVKTQNRVFEYSEWTMNGN